jgi:hypothetical protein
LLWNIFQINRKYVAFIGRSIRGTEMKTISPHPFRGLLPLFLTLCIILAGFLLLVVRQNNFHIQERKGDLQIQNITAQKDLGKLIVGDLRKIANNTYMIL